MLFQSKNRPRERRGSQRDVPARNPLRQTPIAGQNRTFSYYANRSQAELNTGREAAQSKPPLRRLPTKLQRLRKHAGWLAVAVLLIGLVVYQMQLSTMPKVVSLAATSDAPFLQDSQVYQEAAHKLFNESAANRNKLTVNASDIAARLRKQFPELQDVSVSLPLLGDKPTVYVRPAAPALVLAASNGTFIIDENGRPLAEVNGHTNVNRLHIPTVTDQSSLRVRLGEQVLPRSATQFVQAIVGQLKAKKIAVQSMTLPAAAGELNVYIADKPYFVKFNLQEAGKDAMLAQVGTFLALSKQLDGEGVTPAEYVDVRLAGRAYYK